MPIEKTVTAIEKINLLLALEIVKALEGESVKEALYILASAKDMIMEHSTVPGTMNKQGERIRALQTRDEPGKLGVDQAPGKLGLD